MDDTPRLARTDPSASRDEVLAHFRDDVYGRCPAKGWDLSWELLSEHRTATHVLRQQWSLAISTERGAHRCVVMVDLPEGPGPAPTFLGLNFRGNHACTADPDVLDIQDLPPSRYGPIHYGGLREAVTLPAARGIEAHRWPSELVTSRGYAVITSCYLQCGPDSVDIFGHGIHPLFATTSAATRDSRSWGAISIWAWLLSRILDALEAGMGPGVDAGRVAVLGHSRLGKTALWAAAQDPRFAAAISNDSGCMGAAQSRDVGETPEVLARIRPYWFAPRFSERVLAGALLPVDQHQLIASIAPRPVYVASASEDLNADPQGELASLLAAAPAWAAGGAASPLPQLDCAPQLPPPDTAHQWDEVPLGHHLRRGGHEMLPWDWMQWLDFADRWL